MMFQKKPKVLRFTLLTVLLVLAITGVHSLFFKWQQDESFHARAILLNLQKINQLYTGFAYVTLLDYKKDSKGRSEGFCYRLYEVGVGYKNLSTTLSDYLQQNKLLEPDVLSINTVEARIGGVTSQQECDTHDLIYPQNTQQIREFKLVELMRSNQQWETQIENAQRILKGMAGLFKLDKQGFFKREETSSVLSLMRSAHADELIMNHVTSLYLAGLKVTYSVVGVFSREGLWIFSNDKYYIRKDLAEVVYGSAISSGLIEQEEGGLFSDTRYRITLSEPKQISINRFIVDIDTNASSNFNWKSKQQTTIEEEMLAALNKQVSGLDARARQLTKDLLRQYLLTLFSKEDSPGLIDIRFEQ